MTQSRRHGRAKRGRREHQPERYGEVTKFSSDPFAENIAESLGFKAHAVDIFDVPGPLADGKEETLLKAVVGLLGEYLTIAWYHHGDSRKMIGVPGAPDLVMAGPDKMMFRELKGSDTRVQVHQQHWLVKLQGAGMDAEIWRPEDWASGRIQRELEVLSRYTNGGPAGA